jgi:hypothetical protein
MIFFSLGFGESERLEVRVADDCSSVRLDDWLEVHVKLTIQGIVAEVPISIIPAEVARFKEELAVVYREVGGSAEFKTMEGQLSIRVSVDKLGHVTTSGVLKSDLSGSSHVSFTLKFDQTLLWHTISEIDEFLFATTKNG